MKNTRQFSGFTLIEVVIVVAIISILAAVAYPSYRESILKGKRAEARAAMAEFLQQQERYLTQRNVYLQINEGQESSDIKNYSGNSWANRDYGLFTAMCAGETTYRNCVEVVATTTKDPKVSRLRWQSTGQKSCEGTQPELCWK